MPDALKDGLADGDARRPGRASAREATWTLGAMVPPPAGAAAEASLAANLRDPDDSVRVAAARVAGAVRAASLGDALVAAMNDPRQEVQLAAMRALGDIGEKRASRALRERFVHDQHGPGAEAALDGLARLADPASQPVFFEQVASKDADLRRAAFEGLARLGDVAAIRAVEARTGGERDRTVRLARAFALARDGGRGLPELTAALGDDRRAEQVMAYLVELGRAARQGAAAAARRSRRADARPHRPGVRPRRRSRGAAGARADDARSRSGGGARGRARHRPHPPRRPGDHAAAPPPGAAARLLRPADPRRRRAT